MPMRTINREQVLAKAGHVVLLMGGTSSEREISLLSGQAVASSLVSLGVHTTVIDVGENIVDELKLAAPDLVVNMLHGQGGEDGVIQGCLDLLQIPYTGSGVLASALAMDKFKSKQIWCQMGLATAPFTVLNDDSDWEEVIEGFERVVVKPIYGGSSLGIAIADSPGLLERAYIEACEFRQGVMAEKYIEGPEYSTGVLDDELMPTILLETDGNSLILLPNMLTRAHELSVQLRSAASVWRQLRPWLKVLTERWAAAGLPEWILWKTRPVIFSCWR